MGRLSLLPQAGSSLPVTPRFTPGDSPAVVLRNGVLFQGTQAAKSPLGPGYYNLPNNDIVKKVRVYCEEASGVYVYCHHTSIVVELHMSIGIDSIVLCWFA